MEYNDSDDEATDYDDVVSDAIRSCVDIDDERLLKARILNCDYIEEDDPHILQVIKDRCNVPLTETCKEYFNAVAPSHQCRCGSEYVTVPAGVEEIKLYSLDYT
jgi:hypothetical protein